ncbi:MAG: T9SS type A sorting domain-containing protein [Bacteroidales bacterium]|nr:T9SS type A sorting domain-containing protein [Bacteroidales bacterium]
MNLVFRIFIRKIYASILLSTLFLIISFSLLAQVPTDQDCLGSIAVCTDYYYQDNSYSGTGNYPNEINPGPSCMDSGEKNDVWYIITVQTPGDLGFLISPNQSTDDYDWAVYNLTEAECADIYFDASLEVSCNWSGTKGDTGPNGGSNYNSQGASGTPFNALIPVLEGETYVINISNFSSTQYGYSLDFSLSTALIYDDVNPFIVWIQESIGCAGDTELDFEFQENVLCSTISPSDFSLTGPSSEVYNITEVFGEGCDVGGEQENAYTITFDPPITEGGDYILQIVGQITDLCNNDALSMPITFPLEAGIPYVDFDGLYPFNCENDPPLLLTGNHESGEYWADCGDCIVDNGDGTALFYLNLAGLGIKNVTYTFMDEGGCADTITRLTTVRSLPVQYTVAGGGEYCEGSEGPEVYFAENSSDALVNYELYLDGTTTGQVILGTGIGGINFGPQNTPGIYTVTASGTCGESNMLGEAEIVMGELPAQYNISGGGPYCEDINGTDIDLSDSQQGVVYELIQNDVLTGITLDGTGNPISFTNITSPGWYKIFGDNGICTDTMSGSVHVVVNPVPLTDAGEDQSIPYGTSTTLVGSGSGGTGDLGYHWEPFASLLDPDISSPTTINLELTTTFNLTVSDVNGCDSDDEMVVTVTGGPLGITVSADPEVLCQGESSQLHSTAGGGSEVYTYSWTSSPSGFISSEPDPLVTPLVTTVYTLVLSDGYNTVDASVTVTVNALPGTTAWADDVTLPYGSTTILHAEASNTTGPHSYSWMPSSLVPNATSSDPATVGLEYTTVFIVTITNDPTGCYDSDEVEVEVTGGPLQIVSLSADPDEMCNTGDPVYLEGQVLGGTGEYSYLWTSDPPGFTSPSHNAVANPTETTVYTLTVSDGHAEIFSSIEVVVNELPIANAGSNDTIPYGTWTTLNGSATGGAGGTYNYYWEPSDSLLDANIPDPQTVNLGAPTIFTLQATDYFGCTDYDEMLVHITGGPLGVSLYASPDTICQLESTTLKAYPYGGSEEYIFTWKDDTGAPIGNDTSVVVWPLITTEYTLVVDDGYNETTNYLTVHVNPLPEIDIIPEGSHVTGEDTIIVCVYDTIILDPAMGLGYQHEWDNHSPDEAFQVSTTGIGFDMQTHWVRVENDETGCYDTAFITVVFSFAECTGIPSLDNLAFVKIYPNPADGLFNILLKGIESEVVVEVISMNGQSVYYDKFFPLSTNEIIRKIDIKNHPVGIYFVRFISDNFIHVEKIIKY